MINNNKISTETVSAIFIIIFASFFILANLFGFYSLPLFIMAVVIGGAIAFFYPRSGLAAIIFLTFIFERFFTLQPIQWGRSEYKLYPLDIIFIAVLAGAFFNYLINGSKEKMKKIDLIFLAFIILAVIYFLVSAFILKTDFNLSVSSLKSYVFYPLLYLAIILLFNNLEKILWLLKFALAGAIGIIFFIGYGLVTGSGLWSEFTPLSTEGVRTLAFTHAFYLSMTLIGLTALLIFKKNYYTLNRGREKVYNNLYFILIMIWIVGIIGSMMRHLWIALIIALTSLYFLIPKKNKKNYFKLAVKSASIVIFVVMFATYFTLLFPLSKIGDSYQSVVNIISSRMETLIKSSSDESFFWRGSVWKEAAKEYVQSPMLGIGFGKKIYVEIDNYRDFIEVRNIHNSPLVILVQMGIAGIVLFIAIVWNNLKGIFIRSKKDWIDIALFSTLVFYLFAFLFQPYLETNLLGIFFWIILGLIRVKSYENTGDK